MGGNVIFGLGPSLFFPLFLTLSITLFLSIYLPPLLFSRHPPSLRPSGSLLSLSFQSVFQRYVNDPEMGPQCVGGVAWMSKPGPVNPAHTHACTGTHTCAVKISTLHAYSQSYVRALHVLTVHTHLRIYRQTMQTHAHKYMWRTPIFALSQSKGTLSTAVMWETSLMANASFPFLNQAGRKVIMNLRSLKFPC